MKEFLSDLKSVDHLLASVAKSHLADADAVIARTYQHLWVVCLFVSLYVGSVYVWAVYIWENPVVSVFVWYLLPFLFSVGGGFLMIGILSWLMAYSRSLISVEVKPLHYQSMPSVADMYDNYCEYQKKGTKFLPKLILDIHQCLDRNTFLNESKAEELYESRQALLLSFVPVLMMWAFIKACGGLLRFVSSKRVKLWFTKIKNSAVWRRKRS